jgi:hypothetical protein
VVASPDEVEPVMDFEGGGFRDSQFVDWVLVYKYKKS